MKLRASVAVEIRVDGYDERVDSAAAYSTAAQPATACSTPSLTTLPAAACWTAARCTAAFRRCVPAGALGPGGRLRLALLRLALDGRLRQSLCEDLHEEAYSNRRL